MDTVRKPTEKSKLPIGLLPKHASEAFKTDLASALEKLRADDSLSVVNRFRTEYQCQSFLSKYADETETPANVRASNAVKKWLSVETRNARSNFRIQFDECTFREGGARLNRTSFTSDQVLKRARLLVMDIIGEEPPEGIFADWSELTNGASTRVKRGPVAITEKFSGKAHVTADANEIFRNEYLRDVFGFNRVWIEGGNSVELVDSSVMFTVPKSSDIDRVACKEPEINMFLQRGVGNYIRHRLKRIARVDLNDQTVNQRLAESGSLMGKPGYRGLATIDLSSASDSVTEGLVVEVLPPAWFVLLNQIRVKTTILPDGTVHKLNMFSSMGNGFTFELESLLFYTIAKAVCHLSGNAEFVSVYGDDIIVGTDSAALLRTVLAWFGFKFNNKKSFWKGPFRESCGAHWYDGRDVTPFYLRGVLVHQTDLINQLNQLREWICRPGDHGLWSYTLRSDGSYKSDLVSVYYRYAKLIWNSVKGGKDVEDKSCLVTPGRPERRFVASVRKVKGDSLGAYLYWLHRRGEREFTPSIAGRSGPYRLASNATWVQVLGVELYLLPELMHEDPGANEALGIAGTQ